MSNPATGNVFKQLRELITDRSTYVGRSLGPNGDGRIRVELVGSGEIMYATGSASLNQYVFVNNGIVTGLAPTLTPVVLDV